MRPVAIVAEPVAAGIATPSMMKALVYSSPRQREWQTMPKPVLRDPATYDVLLAQRLFLQPRIETNVAVRGDAEIGVGAGCNDAEIGARLRFEIRREFAAIRRSGVERKLRGHTPIDLAGRRRSVSLRRGGGCPGVVLGSRAVSR